MENSSAAAPASESNTPSVVRFHASQDFFESIALSSESPAQQSVSNPSSIVKRLSLLDRYLTLWIFSAMLLGVLVGYFAPSTAQNINSWQSGSTNIPIAFEKIVAGLRVPVFSSQFCVCAGEHGSTKLGRVFFLSLLLNWVVAPLLMFFLSMACLPDHADYMRGVITVGIARCIAMVVIWNNLAEGSAELATVLVVLNSVFQIIMFSFLSYLFVTVLPPLFGFPRSVINVGIGDVAESVAIYLAIPFFAGVVTRVAFVRVKGLAWFEREFVPRIGPLTLIALLFTIIIMFILKGSLIVTIPLDILRICVPLCVYFGMVFFASFALAYKMGLSYTDACTVSFTAASNNFELAIAVAIGQFGLNSGEALATVVGPLVEVPVMLALVHVALFFRRWPRLHWPTVAATDAEQANGLEIASKTCGPTSTSTAAECERCKPAIEAATASETPLEISTHTAHTTHTNGTHSLTHRKPDREFDDTLEADCRRLLTEIGVIKNIGEARAGGAIASFARLRAKAAFMRHFCADDRCLVFSGGSNPSDRVNPVAVSAMKSKGIDIADEFPKPVTADVAEAADIIVSMGCGDQICSRFPKKSQQKYVDWGLEDPHGKGEDVVAGIRDQIFERVVELAKQLQCGDCGCHAL